MGWFKNISNIIKTASKAEIKNNALALLQKNVDPRQVAMQFVMQMSQEDPTFAQGGFTQQIMNVSQNAEALSSILNNFDIGEEMVTPSAPEELPQTLTDIPAEEITPEETGPAGPDDMEPTVPENVVTEEGILGEENVLTKQLDEAPNFNDRVSSDPTLMHDFEIPVARIPKMTKRLGEINKKLVHMYHPEIKIEFSGDAYNKPIFDGGIKVGEEPFCKVKITGTLPSPTEEIAIRIKEPVFNRKGDPVYEADGKTQKTKKVGDEPAGVKLIAKIHHHPLTQQEQEKYLKTEKPDSNLRRVIENCQAQGIAPYFNQVEHLEKAYPVEGKFWYSRPQECFSCKARHARVSTYAGVVVPIDQLVDKTGKVRGEDGIEREMTLTTKRNINKNKKDDPVWREVPIKMIKEEDLEGSPQEQFGGNCIDPFDAVQTINKLKKWVKDWGVGGREAIKKTKPPKKQLGGRRGYMPTEALFAVAVNLMRDPDYSRYDDGVLSSSLGRKTNAYIYNLRMKDKPDFNYRRHRYAPRVVEYDKQVGSEAAAWWREKLGSLNPDDDQNKVTISILPTLSTINKPGRTNMQNILEMVRSYLDYNNIELQPLGIEEPEQPTTILDEPIETKEEVQEEVPEVLTRGGVLDELRDVEEGFNFLTQLKHKSSSEWRSGRGYSHYFLDDYNKKYVIFEKYNRDPVTNALDATPSLNFEEGQNYYIRGEKGETSRTYKTTTINNPTIVPPERLQDYMGGQLPEAPVDETDIEKTPIVETPIEETPIEETPVEETLVEEAPILETPPKIPEFNRTKPITSLTEIAKYVVTMGKNRQGTPITPQEFIPLYIKEISRYSPKLNTQHWTDTLNTVALQGNDSLIRYFDKIPNYLGK